MLGAILRLFHVCIFDLLNLNELWQPNNARYWSAFVRKSKFCLKSNEHFIDNVLRRFSEMAPFLLQTQHPIFNFNRNGACKLKVLIYINNFHPRGHDLGVPKICVPARPLINEWMPNIERYLVSDLPFDRLSNTDKQLANAMRAARQGHFAGFFDHWSEVEGRPSTFIIFAISVFQNSVERAALLENASTAELKKILKWYQNDQQVISLVMEILNRRLTPAFAEMAWGSIEFGFQQIQYSPDPSSDESEPDLDEPEIPVVPEEPEVEAEPEAIPELEPLPPAPLFNFEEFQEPVLEDFILPELIKDLGYESDEEEF